ncbi:MAG: hypothetical protein HY430_00075 [Candidatus Levybacteria bacterium]|nr:hypothetical protein [Candidatus Levybacteria bacterium]
MKKQSKKKRAKKQSPVVKLIYVTVIIIIIALLGYSVYAFKSSEENYQEFFICNNENTVCESSKHVHADITMHVCGKNVFLPKDAGRLDHQHTHKEQNKIHWHARLRVDPKTRKPLDSSLLTTRAFLHEINYALPQSCMDNATPSLRVFVNGKEKAEGLEYIWTDNDQIIVEYK